MGIYYPTFEAGTNSWYVRQGGSPVADLNANGQVVGLSSLFQYPVSGYSGPATYAAFSDPTGNAHGGSASTSDNLNNYLADALGVYLTSAVKIDDMGRIIAEGTLNGQDQEFLLTPAGLSSAPIPTPEPKALVTMTVALMAWAARSARSRRRGMAIPRLKGRSASF